MARKLDERVREMRRRLAVAHNSARAMSAVAGRLLQQVKSLQRDVSARDLLISQLKEQLIDAELMYARAMKD